MNVKTCSLHDCGRFELKIRLHQERSLAQTWAEVKLTACVLSNPLGPPRKNNRMPERANNPCDTAPHKARALLSLRNVTFSRFSITPLICFAPTLRTSSHSALSCLIICAVFAKLVLRYKGRRHPVRARYRCLYTELVYPHSPCTASAACFGEIFSIKQCEELNFGGCRDGVAFCEIWKGSGPT